MKLVNNNQKVLSKCSYKFSIFCIFFLGLGIYIGLKNLPGFIKANIILLVESNIFNAFNEKNNLETITLDIPFENLRKISEKRQTALKINKLFSSDDDFVKAVISHDGVSSKCKVRLKGDLPDHWSGEKFSLRVEMKGEKLLKGMSVFSLQDPATRSDTEEWLFLNTLKREDCMGVKYYFVNLIINGKKMGIYALEEHFSKEFIETNRRREGVIVRFDDYYIWKKSQPFESSNIEWNSIYRSSPPLFRNKSRVRSNINLSKQCENAMNLLRLVQTEEINASNVFDADKLGKFLAISHIWHAAHGFGIDDINFYFNPVTALLEPIGFGAEPGFYGHFCYFTSGGYNETWVNYSLKDPVVASSYLKYLDYFSSENYLLGLKNEYSVYETKIRNLLLCEFLWKGPTIIWKNYHKIFKYNPWENLFNRCAKIKSELSEKRLVNVHGFKLHSSGNDYKVVVRNSTAYPVEIISLQTSNQKWLPQNLIANSDEDHHPVNPLTGNLYLPPHKNGLIHTEDDLLLNIENISSSDNVIYLEAKFLGLPSPVILTKINLDKFSFDIDQSPFGQQKLKLDGTSHEFKQNSNTITIKKGVYEINNDLFIPYGHKLVVEPGVNFLFSSNSTLISRSPILAVGNERQPIVFKAKSNSWAGILIESVDKNLSLFKNVHFEDIHGVGSGPNPSGSDKNAWVMTGGVTISRSKVRFEKCIFDSFSTEDALNIISSNFEIIDTNFSNTFSDAFDGDFVVGTITDCKFDNVNGDAIDFSGSDANISKSSFYKISDKAISVGENSKVNIKSCSISDVSFGIVSKDSSYTNIESNTSVKKATIAAFSAFQKKALFGPAFLKANEVSTDSCMKDFLIQERSVGLVNNVKLPTLSFDTQELY